MNVTSCRLTRGKTARDCRMETSCGMSRDPTELLRKKTFGRYPAPIDLSSQNIMVPLYIYMTKRLRCYYFDNWNHCVQLITVK